MKRTPTNSANLAARNTAAMLDVHELLLDDVPVACRNNYFREVAHATRRTPTHKR